MNQFWSALACFFYCHKWQVFWQNGRRNRKCSVCGKVQKFTVKFTIRGAIEEWI